MTINLTFDEAAELLARAVAEKGADYQYQPDGACKYFEHDATEGYVPSCIIGHVLAYKGVSRLELLNDPTYGDLNAGEGVSQLVNAGILSLDEKAKILLSWAQNEQDYSIAWGEAVKTAHEKVAEGEGESL